MKTPYRAVSNERLRRWFACVMFNQHYSVCTPSMHYGWGTSWTTSSPFVLPGAPVTSQEKPHGPATGLTVPKGELLIRPVASPLRYAIVCTVCTCTGQTITQVHIRTYLQWCLLRRPTLIFVLETCMRFTKFEWVRILIPHWEYKLLNCSQWIRLNLKTRHCHCSCVIIQWWMVTNGFNKPNIPKIHLDI